LALVELLHLIEAAQQMVRTLHSLLLLQQVAQEAVLSMLALVKLVVQVAVVVDQIH
jgi:hypothetical protein